MKNILLIVSILTIFSSIFCMKVPYTNHNDRVLQPEGEAPYEVTQEVQKTEDSEELYSDLIEILMAQDFVKAKKLIDENNLDVEKKINDRKPLYYVMLSRFNLHTEKAEKLGTRMTQHEQEMFYDMIRYLVEDRGASLKDLDQEGNNALHLSIFSLAGRRLLSYFLSKASMDVLKSRNDKGVTPLDCFFASEPIEPQEFYYPWLILKNWKVLCKNWKVHDYLFYINEFLKKGLEAADRYTEECLLRTSPLHIAVLNGTVELVMEIVDSDIANVNMIAQQTIQELPKGNYAMCNECGVLDLLAFRRLDLGEHETIAKLLLSQGAKPTQETYRRFASYTNGTLKDNLIHLLRSRRRRRRVTSQDLEAGCAVGEG